MKNSRFETDLTTGPLLPKILSYYIPLMLSAELQLLFNAADVIVVGRFAGSDALAAVGSTSSLINLLSKLFIGLGIGANVLVAHYKGAEQDRDLSDIVHTAVATSLIGGVLLMILGIAAASPALLLMGSPEGILPLAVRYMRIYFVGTIFNLVYNYGSSILNAMGDTTRPLIFLSLAGVVNVILNLFFVIGLRMGVAGVAWATVLSQGISAVLIFRCLCRLEGPARLIPSKLSIRPHMLLRMLGIGLPAGLQGCLFSISNVIIQSSVNSFGPVVMAGNAASANIEGFIYSAMYAYSQTAISFVGQNIGAKRFDRIRSICHICLVLVTVTGLVLGGGAYLIGRSLLGLYSTDPEVVVYGLVRMLYICVPYFLCGLMDTMVGMMRGMGYSTAPMIVSLTGACLLRIVWIFTYFQTHHTPEVLYVSYPISWAVTFLAHVVCYRYYYRKSEALQPVS
ncbi:MAG: MATE family efflux transporter [Lachnospiraceae bacterium]|nr:MATE family efflux transporter [Lachnospiraceae bacterium]